MSELLYNKSKAVEELNKVEGFYPLELARVISNDCLLYTSPSPRDA